MNFVVPMVFASGVFQFLQLHSNDTIVKITYAGGHICNAVTYILFTVALFIWSCFLNRKHAWRWLSSSQRCWHGQAEILTYYYYIDSDVTCTMPTTIPNPNFFAGSPLNRLSWLRSSHVFLNALFFSPATRWIVFNGGQPLVASGPSSGEQCW
jgi:hypothetical protein